MIHDTRDITNKLQCSLNVFSESIAAYMQNANDTDIIAKVETAANDVCIIYKQAEKCGISNAKAELITKLCEYAASGQYERIEMLCNLFEKAKK